MPVGQNADTTIYCPFGCNSSEVEEHGYCAHLIGFTNDGKVLEPITHTDRGGVAVRGRKRHRQEVQKKDKQVNPILQGKDPRSGVVVDYFKWVSARVYRQCSEEEKLAWIERWVDADFEEEEEDAEQVAQV